MMVHLRFPFLTGSKSSEIDGNNIAEKVIRGLGRVGG
jgi:hypothetical protein